MKQENSWFDEEILVHLYQRKQVKMQRIQDPSQSNEKNLNNVGCEASRYFRKQKKACLKAKLEKLVTNSKVKSSGELYRGINDLKKGYQLIII